MEEGGNRQTVQSETRVPYNVTPRWIKAEDSPFGVEVLDLRGTFVVKVSYILRGLDDIENNPSSEETLRKVRKMHPEPYLSFKVICNLSYPVSSRNVISDGLLCKPLETGQEWCIFSAGQDMIFYSVDRRNVMYRARYRLENDTLRIRFIEANMLVCHLMPSLAIANLDFIIKSSLFGKVVPHPIPSFIPREIDRIISYTRFAFDSRAVFATYEDTLSIDWLSLERF